MPHCVVEYTSNIRTEARIPELLEKVNTCLMSFGDTFPTGGIRSRAAERTEYRIADGAEDDAFVHVSLTIGSGRSDAVKKQAGDVLFAMLREHFAGVFARRYLALSMEIGEFSEQGTWKQNNLHARFRGT